MAADADADEDAGADGDAGPVPDLRERALAGADRLLAVERVAVASHIDADGLTSAGIATTALERAGLAVETIFEDQLDDDRVAAIAAREESVVLFTDFGSGQFDAIARHEARGDFEAVVADHHRPVDADGVDVDVPHHLNPLLVGIDGASELSGAGAAYLLARAIGARTGGDNRDLAALAVVGAVGDRQVTDGALRGANAAIVREGVEAGAVAERTDLAAYGKQTRPLPKLLEYATDTRVPGISGSATGAKSFLDGLDVDCRADEEDRSWKRWIDLTDGERQRVASALLRHAVDRGVPADRIDDLVATSYTLPGEPAGTELRDASEFSTLLNATARYDRADVGLAVCLGDRGDGLARARRLLRTHRRNLSEGLTLVRERGVTREEHLQWFDAGDEIRETVVGIVAGMAVGADGIDRGTPIVAFADADEGDRKVSSRATPGLVRRGLDLSVVMSEASAAVGGGGGGHDVAAGATIPAGEEEAFLAAADRLVGEQLGAE
jgi:RecJ-like exonuclease